MEHEKANEDTGRNVDFFDNYKYEVLLKQPNSKLIDIIRELSGELDKLTVENSLLKRKLKQNESFIKSLSDNEDISVKYQGYQISWRKIEKVIFVLSRNQRPMLTKEIVDEMILIEPQLKQLLRDTFNSISKVIYHAVKLNRINKHNKKGAYGFTYILPEWIDKGHLNINKI